MLVQKVGEDSLVARYFQRLAPVREVHRQSCTPHLAKSEDEVHPVGAWHVVPVGVQGGTCSCAHYSYASARPDAGGRQRVFGIARHLPVEIRAMLTQQLGRQLSNGVDNTTVDN